MTDTPIRTHTTTLDQEDIERGLVPVNWGPGTQVLVVAGLPEGAELRRLCDVPEGWEWQNDAGNWHPAHRFSAEDECTGYVLCRPKPVPAPPATPDLTPLFDALDSYDESPSADMPDVDRAVDALVAAVRALRDGETR